MNQMKISTIALTHRSMRKLRDMECVQLINYENDILLEKKTTSE